MKKVGIVLVSTLALASAMLAPGALGAGGGAGTGRGVTVSIKTLTKTLLAPTREHGKPGWITKGGTPRGKCPGNSAAGALDVATRGHWTGKYYSVGRRHLHHVDQGREPRGLRLLGAWSSTARPRARARAPSGLRAAARRDPVQRSSKVRCGRSRSRRARSHHTIALAGCGLGPVPAPRTSRSRSPGTSAPTRSGQFQRKQVPGSRP